MTALCTARKCRKARPRGVAEGVTALACLLAACAPEPPPRGFHEFMEDRIARDGVLARCAAEEGGESRSNEIECANARRAAATIALREERARREELERESRRKIEALRARIGRREAAARESEREAALSAERSYDEQWEDGVPGSVTAPTAAGGGGQAPGAQRAELPGAGAEQPQAAERGAAADPRAVTLPVDDAGGATRTAANAASRPSADAPAAARPPAARSGAMPTAAEPHDALQEIAVPERRRLSIGGD